MSIGAQDGEIEFIGDKLFCLRFFMLLNKASMGFKRHFADDYFIGGITMRGHQILNNPFKNKGTAFTQEERQELGLVGLLPPYVQTLEEQAAQTYAHMHQKGSDLEKTSFLDGNLQYKSYVILLLILTTFRRIQPNRVRSNNC